MLKNTALQCTFSQNSPFIHHHHHDNILSVIKVQ